PQAQSLQVFPLGLREQLGVALAVEVQRRLPEVELLPPEAVEERLDVLPIALRQPGRGLGPAAWCGDEVPNDLVARFGNVVLDPVERRAQLILGQDGAGRRLLAQEARSLAVDGRVLRPPFRDLTTRPRCDATELARVLRPPKGRERPVEGVGHSDAALLDQGARS